MTMFAKMLELVTVNNLVAESFGGAAFGGGTETIAFLEGAGLAKQLTSWFDWYGDENEPVETLQDLAEWSEHDKWNFHVMTLKEYEDRETEKNQKHLKKRRLNTFLKPTIMIQKKINELVKDAERQLEHETCREDWICECNFTAQGRIDSLDLYNERVASASSELNDLRLAQQALMALMPN